LPKNATNYKSGTRKIPKKNLFIYFSPTFLTFPKTQSLTKGLAAGIGVFYNYTGSVSCYNVTANAVSTLGDNGWDYQSNLDRKYFF
jgi:hypothetical protein